MPYTLTKAMDATQLGAIEVGRIDSGHGPNQTRSVSAAYLVRAQPRSTLYFNSLFIFQILLMPTDTSGYIKCLVTWQHILNQTRSMKQSMHTPRVKIIIAPRTSKLQLKRRHFCHLPYRLSVYCLQLPVAPQSLVVLPLQIHAGAAPGIHISNYQM